jgi:hypothetical protein
MGPEKGVGIFIPLLILALLSLDSVAVHYIDCVVRWLIQHLEHLCIACIMRSSYILLAFASAALVSANPLFALFDRNTCNADDCAR